MLNMKQVVSEEVSARLNVISIEINNLETAILSASADVKPALIEKAIALNEEYKKLTPHMRHPRVYNPEENARY